MTMSLRVALLVFTMLLVQHVASHDTSNLSKRILSDEELDALAHDSSVGVLSKFASLAALQATDVDRFFSAVLRNVDEFVPVVYTPGVGAACQNWGYLPAEPQSMILSLDHRGEIEAILRAWADRHSTPKAIVVTDGERILGLGDLGVWGMGIPVGKLNLYTALAGIPPWSVLPIVLDVGTNTESLQNNPKYKGLKKRRAEGQAYDSFVEEFILAVKTVYPSTLLQFEDFGKQNAFRLLAKYEDQLPTFNDDIQGTAAVTVAGLLSAFSTQGGLHNKRFLFYGAGQAAVGICDLIVQEIIESAQQKGQEILDIGSVRRQCLLVDSKGAVHSGRTNLAPHKLRYAHSFGESASSDFPESYKSFSLAELVREWRPHALIGVSTQPQTFTEEIVRQMAKDQIEPVIFSLSNPTSKAECTAEQAYYWSDGRVLFASGSPFPPVPRPAHLRTGTPSIDDTPIRIGQANNCFVFPGIGLGVLLAQSRKVTSSMILAAARVLHKQVTSSDRKLGILYPTLSQARDVSAAIALSVFHTAIRENVADVSYIPASPTEFMEWIRSEMYNPDGKDKRGLFNLSQSGLDVTHDSFHHNNEDL